MPPVNDIAGRRDDITTIEDVSSTHEDGRPQTSLDEALEDTFPASDPVAASVGDNDAGASSSSPARASDANPSLNEPATPAPAPDFVRFPTSRRAGSGTEDERATLQLRANAVQMLQSDHAQLFVNAQKFRPRLSFDRKRALADTACIVLEIHLQLKEEIFYPALSRVMAKDDETLTQAIEALDTLRDEIGRLRGLRPWDDEFDAQFMTLMNKALHGIADEETRLFPIAQQRMVDELDALGTQMSHRRMQLMGPHLAALTINTMRTLPFAGLLAGVGAFAGGLLLARSFGSRRD